MIKHMSIINRNASQTPEEFRAYWMNVHSEMVKDMLPGLRKYVANFPAELGGHKAPGSGQDLVCDAIIELHFDSVEALQAAMQSDGWQSQRRKESSAKLIDLNRNLLFVAEEVVKVGR